MHSSVLCEGNLLHCKGHLSRGVFDNIILYTTGTAQLSREIVLECCQNLGMVYIHIHERIKVPFTRAMPQQCSINIPSGELAIFFANTLWFPPALSSTASTSTYESEGRENSGSSVLHNIVSV
jgi:hypothetical protein